jgi:hypothetical protein
MDFNDNETETDFDIFADDEAPKAKGKPQRDETIVVEAIQVVRMVKSVNGVRSREVLDTIKVTYPSMTYERALKIANHKARILGYCMVIEKCERILDGY